MSKHMRRVYNDFVVEGSFMFTDVFDTRGLLTQPCEDPMGVVAAAVSIIRALYAGDDAARMFRPGMYLNLHSEARHYMAAALFIAYKAKSEDSWQGGSMTRAVLSRFVTELEYPSHYERTKMASLVVQAETNLLNTLPVLALVDGNIHSVVEIQLGVLTAPCGQDSPVLTNVAAAAILSVFAFYYNLVTVHTETELIEELCDEHGIGDVAMGFIAIGAASMAAVNTFDDCDKPTERLSFGLGAIKSAMRLISAALRKDLDRSRLSVTAVHVQALTARSTVLHAHALIQSVYTSLDLVGPGR